MLVEPLYFVRDRVFPGGQRHPILMFKCDCGVEFEAMLRELRNGKRIDCGHRRRTSNRAYPTFSPEDKDLEDVAWRKHPAGYGICGGGRRKDFSHRIVLERKIGRKLEDGEITDHINRNKLDNRRENLRVADKSINSINRDMRPDNSTGYIGVYLYWPKEYQDRGWAKRWDARIQRKGYKTVYLGYYRTPREAHTARSTYLKDNNIY